MMLDKDVFKTCPAFIDLIVDKFSLDPEHFRSPSAFLVKELTDQKVHRIEDIKKDDQLVLLSEYLIRSYNPHPANPEESEEVSRILQKRNQPSYLDIFGNPSIQPPPPVKDELL
jgi:hypothetical protein